MAYDRTGQQRPVDRRICRPLGRPGNRVLKSSLRHPWRGVHGRPRDLRISSQLRANWLVHGIVTQTEVDESLVRLVAVVDARNTGHPAHEALVGANGAGLAFQARDLIIDGLSSPKPLHRTDPPHGPSQETPSRGGDAVGLPDRAISTSGTPIRGAPFPLGTPPGALPASDSLMTLLPLR